MRGGEPVDYDEAGSIEDLDRVEALGPLGDLDRVDDLGPVGSWALPSVFHRITRPAWFFICLAIASLVADVSIVVVPAVVDGSSPLSSTSILSFLARSAPVLLPAAILWNPARPRLRWSDPLVAGSVAIALSTFLGIVVSRGLDVIEDGVLATSPQPIVMAMRLVVGALAVAGPLLVAVALLRLRTGPVSRPAIRVGIVIAILAIATAFVTLNQSVSDLLGGGSATFDQAFDDYVRSQAVLGVFAAFTVIAQAAFAWAVIAARGGTGRTMWLLAVAAVGLEQLRVAVNLLLTLTFRLSPDTGLAIQGLTLQSLMVLPSVAWILLVAAFAMGFGRAAEPGPRASTPAADDSPPSLEPGLAD